MTAHSNDAARLLIIADDLSGTADCAVAGTRCGLDSRIGLGPHLGGVWSDVDVLAIDTDTRRLGSDSAARLNRDAWRRYADGRRLYKKIDSTLRGHVAAEIAALADAGMAIVAPAFPAAGRTTVGGRQYVFGEPVEQTEVWRNEGISGAGDLVAMLSRGGLRVAHVDLAAVRGNVAALRDRFVACRAARSDAVVCDSETNDDLANVAAASSMLDGVFWAGSAGLAAPLVARLAGETRSAAPCDGVPGLFPGPGTAHPRGILTLVGSMSSVSHRQVAELYAAAAGSVDRFEVDARELLDPVSVAALTLATRVAAALMRGRHAIVALDQAERVAADDGVLLARCLADHLAPAVDHAAGVIATGGETARALLSAIGVNMLQVVAEIETGVPLLAADHHGRVLPVVTKAGGFGLPDSLHRAWQRLVAMQQADAHPARPFSGEEDMTYRPVIGITMGDAAGVGPEIIMKSLAHASVYDGCRPLVIGDARRLTDAARRTGVSLAVRPIAKPADAQFRYGEVDCIDLGLIPVDLPYGKLSPVAGDAAYQYIARTVELTSAGELDAICTAPLNKEALHAGGHIFPGHTEMLAHLTGIPEVSMMLVAPKLRVIHVTTHIGIIDAIRRIEPGLVQRTIERAHETLVRAGIESPRIGVCGINPHAGENGLFGYGEEEEKIVPAVAVLRERGWDVEGPLPADTLFFRAGRGDFDVVVAMYHDQGHGPVKVMGLEAGVNVTVGLPVIRTSVDHGTAFDIAGKGIADEGSLLEALKQAQDLATRRAVQAA
ncbi:4-hydroxythreonine-4-phosphate dehydrogenase PdxA [Burkholderia sp. BCC1630]|uniref:4-hydroxythreonine-4-phosphate dehydrogenase PdxA n=1 Tax=Burkholderia sp. BCC1630 TaxID=2676304 RepID=UPI00158BE93A|nr:4-hydroxythreonine-4-phosphate dehydrogenase PdxA [Burkholderia sp. BCC1630]